MKNNRGLTPINKPLFIQLNLFLNYSMKEKYTYFIY